MFLKNIAATFLLILSSSPVIILSQDYVDECPTDFGFFADAVQCDRYYECKEGEVCNIRNHIIQFIVNIKYILHSSF